MMFKARRPSTRWHRRTTALVPVFSAGLAAKQALRTSRAPAWRIRSAAIAAWLLLPVAAHGQERVPDLVEPGIDEFNSHVTEAAVITSVGLDPGATTVGFSTSSHAGFDVFSAPLSGFPTEGSSFFVISSGSTASAPTPNNSGSTTTILEGLNTSVGTDLVSISFVMTPPAGAQCLAFDFKFFSEEFPEFVGGGVNDTFLAETPASTFTIVGGNAVAPNNVAFDSVGDPVTVDTTGQFGMTLANAFDTTYDGATVLLTTEAPIEVDGSGNATMVFSIMDLGDSSYDTTAFLDNFRWGNADCEPVTATPTPTATPAATPTATPDTSATPTPLPPPPPPGGEDGLVWVYHSEADDGTPGCISSEGTCGITGGPGDSVYLYIDGGTAPGDEGETVCMLGNDGSSGDILCGANILVQMQNGHFTGIGPTIDTLMCNPSCADCDEEEEGICPIPAESLTTTIRMNFRRGDAFAPPAAPPPAGPRRVATLLFDSSGDSPETPTKMFANGVGAAGANLQLRPIANVVQACTGEGVPFSCCSGVATSDDGRWPCGAWQIAPTDPMPEPGQLLQLLSGLAGLGCLYRLRRRA